MRGFQSLRPRRRVWWASSLLALAVILILAVIGSGDPSPTDSGTPGDATRGEALFEGNCSSCHGSGAIGTAQGPPLLHEIYLPDHHSDAAFLLAVRTGVRPHHWNFGSMPAVPGLSDEVVSDIIAYVRALQREAGMIEDSS